MPKVTIDIHLPYDDMPEDEMPEDEVLIVEDISEEEDNGEIVITCPTCGSAIDVEED